MYSIVYEENTHPHPQTISRNDTNMFDLDEEKRRMREYAELMLTHGPKAKNEDEILLYSMIREVLDKGLEGSKTEGNSFSRGPFDSHHDVLQKTIRDLCHKKTRISDMFRFHSISTRIHSMMSTRMRSIAEKPEEGQHGADHREAVNKAIEKIDVRIICFEFTLTSLQ